MVATVPDLEPVAGPCCGLSPTYLEGLDKGPEKGPDSFPSAQQLHQPQHSEKPEEGDGNTGVVLRVLWAKHIS